MSSTTRHLFAAMLVLFTTVAFSQTKPLTIEGIYAPGGLTGRAPETFRWSPDGSKLTFVQRDDSGEHGQLMYMELATGKVDTLLNETKLATLAPPTSHLKDDRERERVSRYSVASYSWAPDSKHLLFSASGQLWYFTLESGTGVQVTQSGDSSDDPKFSPNGKRVAFVRKHQLYVMDADGSSPHAISDEANKDLIKGCDKTCNSCEDGILNGEVDWVYAEELSVRSNYFWSPDSHEIAFLQTDERKVPTYPITDFSGQHPSVDREVYPKAGDPNPVVRIGVVGQGGGRVRWVQIGNNPEYIPRFGWVKPGMLWAETLDRKQQKMELYFVDVNSGKSHLMLTESSDAWVEVNSNFSVLKSGDSFLWTSWRDGFTHIYRYSFDKGDPLSADAKMEKQLTSGDWEVLGVEEVDEDSGTVYFSANPGDPRQANLYAVKLDGSGFRKVLNGDGTHHANVASGAKFVLDTYSTQLTPPVIGLCKPDSTCNKLWEAHSVDDYRLVPAKPLEFKADDGTKLYGSLLLPSDAPSARKIPIVVFIYGGPAGQTVADSWGGDRALFHQMLAKKGYAIFTVDNRGTPNRGKKFMSAIRLQSGGVELRDQLAALDQLLPQFPQLDPKRIAIWGWSNGGSMTLYALTHSDRFLGGVAVAPVTDWHLYDSVYTERYMGLVSDNAANYNDSIVASAGNLHGDLLLVHGLSDDNVHPQNSIQMVDAFIKNGKQFKLMVYPGKTHGIAGKEARTHLFHAIEDQFELVLKEK